jgi:hypothetical protein
MLHTAVKSLMVISVSETLQYNYPMTTGEREREAINKSRIVNTRRRTSREQLDRHIAAWEGKGTHRRCPLVLLITVA